jgi:hypothetical protein
MRQKQSHSESHGKDEVNVERPLAKAGAKKAMARVERLTKWILSVSREQLKREEKRYQIGRKAAQMKHDD